MNLLLIALAALLLLGKEKPREEKKPDLFSEMNNFGILGDGAKNLVDSFSRLNSDGDKTGAIMELISNPIIFNMVKNVLFKDKTGEADGKAADSGGQPAEDKTENTYKEGAAEQKAPEAPAAEQKAKENSEEAKDFFRPVEKVAGIEVSKDLYDLYDDWYLEH